VGGQNRWKKKSQKRAEKAPERAERKQDTQGKSFEGKVIKKSSETQNQFNGKRSKNARVTDQNNVSATAV